MVLLWVQGGVLYGTHSSSSALGNCNVTGSRAIRGGGVAVDAKATLAVTGSDFSNNSNSAIVLQGAAEASVESSTFSNNEALGGVKGGAIFVSNAATLTLTDSSFTANNASDGGALYAEGTPSVSLTGGALTDNEAGTEGGAVALAGATRFTVSGSTFGNNKAGASGGGFAVLDRATGVLSSSSFLRNYALLSGSGVYIARTLPNATDSGAPPVASKLAAAALRSRAATAYAAGAAGGAPNDTVRCVDLLFRDNTAHAQPNAAFFDASFDPASRVTCENCDRGDTNVSSTPPASFQFQWPGEAQVAPNATAANYTLRAAMMSPVLGLQIILLDGYGQPLPQVCPRFPRFSPLAACAGSMC